MDVLFLCRLSCSVEVSFHFSITNLLCESGILVELDVSLC